jgi:hypothetical protein
MKHANLAADCFDHCSGRALRMVVSRHSKERRNDPDASADREDGALTIVYRVLHDAQQ